MEFVESFLKVILGMLETDRVKQARREEVQWCRGRGVWESVLRKDVDAGGAKGVPLGWIDADKGGAGRPNYRSRFVVRSRRPLRNLKFSLQLNSSAECATTDKKRRKASEPLCNV